MEKVDRAEAKLDMVQEALEDAPPEKKESNQAQVDAAREAFKRAVAHLETL